MGTIGGVLVAAGEGKRMGGPERKPFLLLSGVPILVHTARVFARIPEIAECVIVVHREDVLRTETLLATYELQGFRVVPGGERRQDSVLRGVRALSDDVYGVLVHDGVRPFVSEDLMRRLVAFAFEGRVVVPALPLKDTIKEISGRQVLRTPERESFVRVQTPQVFPRNELLRVLEEAERQGWEVTDEASLFERLGTPVFWTEGEERNFKLTTREDLILAEVISRLLTGAFDAFDMSFTDKVEGVDFFPTDSGFEP